MANLVSDKFKNSLKSSMKEHIINFLERKRLSGSPYERQPERLIAFDSLLAEFFPNAVSITSEIADKWVEFISQNNVSNNTIHVRLAPIREFARYLNSIGIPSVIPETKAKFIKPECHLITEQELKAFFKSADSLMPTKKGSLIYITAPVIFRLMYSTGMRSPEVRHLTVSDVNLTTGKIFIRESKAHQLRVILVSDDMLKVLRHYDEIMQQAVPNRKIFFSFHNNDKAISRANLNYCFHDIWDHLPEATVEKSPKMTMRSFRHCFALSCIYKWYKEGKNINAIEDYLVCYMGHSDFRQTSYYIHLAEMVYPEIRDSIHRINDGILPDITSIVDDDEVPYDA